MLKAQMARKREKGMEKVKRILVVLQEKPFCLSISADPLGGESEGLGNWQENLIYWELRKLKFAMLE